VIKVSSESSVNGSLNFPDMTALLDVIFILLVFLLLTANAVPTALEVALPADELGEAEVLDTPDSVTVTVFADKGHWGLESEEFQNWAAFESALDEMIAKEKPPEIILAGDKDVPLEKLLKLFSWLQGHGLNAAQILMRNPAD